MKSQIINCPNCEFPQSFNEPVNSINYPGDIDLALDFIAGDLNLVQCKVCQVSFYLLTTIYVSVGEDLAFVYTLHEETIKVIQEQYLPNNPTLRAAFSTADGVTLMFELLQADKLSLYRKLAKFLQHDIIDADNRLNQAEYKIFLAGVKRIIPMKLATTTGATTTLTVDGVYNHYTFRNLLQCFNDAPQTSLYAEVLKCLPPKCISSKLLDYILDLCETVRNDDTAGLYHNWQIQMLCAVLHDIKNLPNPQINQLTVIIGQSWLGHYFNKEAEVISEMIEENRKIDSGLMSFGMFFETFAQGFNRSAGNIELISYFQTVAAIYYWTDEFNAAMRFNTRVRAGGKKQESSRLSFSSMSLDHINRMKFDADGKYATENADEIGDYFLWLATSGYMDDAITFLSDLLEAAVRHSDFASAISISVIAIDSLNKASLTSYSKQLLLDISEKYEHGFQYLKRRDLLDYYINAGNTYRYTGQFEESLEFSLKAIQLFKKSKLLRGTNYIEGKKTLERNLAIAYRDCGYYAKSLKILEKLYKLYPDDVNVVLSLAAFYVETHNPEMVLKILKDVLHMKIAEHRIEVGIKVAAAQAFLELDNHEEAYASLYALRGFIEKAGIDLKIQVINVSLKISPAKIATDDFLLKLTHQAEQLLSDPTFEKNNYRATTFIFLLSRYLDIGQITNAKNLFESYESESKINSSDIFYNFTLISYFLKVGEKNKAVDILEKIFQTLPEELPKLENKNFINSWFNNKDVYQHGLLKIAFDFFSEGLISSWVLARAVEFQIGSDISSKMPQSDGLRLDQMSFDAFCESHPSKEFLIFFETDQLHVLQISTTYRTIEVFRDIIEVDTIVTLKAKVLRAYNSAFPLNLSFTDAKIEAFNQFLKQVGRIISDGLGRKSDGCYIVAGRSLTNLPMHLICFDDGKTLIEKYPVSFLPNLTMLSRIYKAPIGSAKGLVVSVTKNSDKPEYVKILLQAKKQLIAQLIKGGIDVKQLNQEQATITAITNNLKQVEEALILCHGIQYDDEHGPGLCVSSNRRLPPGLMLRPIDEIKKFVLTWQDLEKINMTPWLVILAACSSGRVVLGKGAVNHSFDQALFTKGTCTIINPIWDTEQESSLLWLSSFYDSRLNNPSYTVGKCYQMACIKTKEKYPHHYFWSPFILKGLF